MRVRDLFIILLVALFGSTLFAQETTGKLQGRVADAQGLAVPGVTVTASGPQGNKTATTDADGRFTIPFLTPGVYVVRAQLQGFKAFEQTDVTVGLGQTVEVPVKMEVGARGRNRQHHGRPANRGHDVRPRSVRSFRATSWRTFPSGAVSPTPCIWLRARAAAARLGAHESVDVRRKRARQPVRHRRRQRHEHRLRRAGLLFDDIRIARQRHAVRLRQGGSGQDWRI